MKLFTLLLTIVSLTMPFAASAQRNIEHLINSFEKNAGTQYVAYSENRNPSTHKLVKSSKVIVLSAAQGKQLKAAIQKDREKATSLQMSAERMYEVVFVDGNERKVYTLVSQRNGTWLLTVEYKNLDNAPRAPKRTSEVPALLPDDTTTPTFVDILLSLNAR